MDWTPAGLAVAAEGLRPLLDGGGIPLDLASLTALAAGLGWASGLRLYALVFVLGALGRFAGVSLPGGLAVLSHPLVLGLSGLLLLVEFGADKLPWLDSVWDAVHTFIRIPAGAALAAAVMGDQGGAAQVALGLLGGTLAAGTHFAKAGTRAALNTSPEPVSNVAASVGEDALFAGGLWTLLHHPLVFLAALALFVVAAGLVLRALWGVMKKVLRLRMRPAAPR
ncbi:MAG TPA: DUF4126 domain-containing protein [Rhodocyclaceae bacterium]|nr:DUF4126 domain-containing protein [Rhodocyclaceae bacterium]HNI83595.1 DUF4126 domain-containing protein [Rhodocyclaceae bacterium]